MVLLKGVQLHWLIKILVEMKGVHSIVWNRCSPSHATPEILSHEHV